MPTFRSKVASALAAAITGATILTACTSAPPMGVASDMAITAAILEGGAPPTFTIQGRLTQAGEPVNQTITLVIVRLLDANTGETIRSFAVDDVVAADGLFTVEVPLPDTEALLAAGPITAQINSRDFGDIGGAITVGYTPRAWTAQRAASAQLADTALKADFAETAGTADAISNTERITLVPEPPFSGGAVIASRVGDLVYLSGSITVSPDSSFISEIVSTLPEGLRPEFPQPFTGTPSITFGTIVFNTSFTVNPDGTIAAQFLTSNVGTTATLGINGFYHVSP